MNAREKRFVELYCIKRKGAESAVEAGYAKKRDKQTAYDLLQRKDIQDAIANRLKELTISADRATKNISDIAETRINDFMIIKKVLKTQMIRVGIEHLIKKLENQIVFENEYATLVDLDEDEEKDFKRKIKGWERDIVRFRLELKHNAKAYRDIESDPEWVEQADLDLVALAKAEELGNIQELSFNEFGPKVKMYSAYDANQTILKLNGKLINKVDHTTDGKSFLDFLMDASTDDE